MSEASAVMANISERDWQQRVVDLAALFEWSFMHVYPLRRAAGFKTPTTARGWPDLALVKGERLLFIELKSRRGVVSPEQEHWLELLSHPAGCECYVWRPADWPEVVRILTDGRASA